MSHRRVKNIDFDDDDIDDYEEDDYGEEELSPEDQEQMRLGKTKVREALGPDYANVADKHIEDALWNYYYDIGKSVSYLKNAHKPAPKKPSQPSRFDQATNLAAQPPKKANGPSPDDEVLNKQAKAFKKSNTAANKKDKETSAVTQGVANLTVEEAPRVKSKNLNVLEEYEKSTLKRSANFVVIGHVDHGKSTLMGRLLYDLKVVDERSIEKLRKEAQNMGKSSFALAWVMDATSEERSRGVTVDIATNTFETEKTRFTILDAPGHQDFVPNMIAGASQADFAVLVIDASANSFESGLRGQTKEHALLARSIGVQQLIIAVNKMDAASWSKERFDEISQQMSAFLTSAGFQPQNVTFVPCAGLTGQNVAQPVPKDVAPWYDGPSLVQALEASEVSKRAVSGPLRMSISDIFRGDITSAVSVAGRIDSGSLQVGDAIVTLPRPATETGTAYIKAIMVDDEPADWAVAGQIPTLHLTNIDPDQLRLGDVICHPTSAVKSITTFTAKILAFEHVMPMFVEVHKGRWNMEGRITKLLATLDKNSGAVLKNKPRVIQPGTVAKIEVQLDRAVPLETAQRVVLRNEGLTVAAAMLEEVK
ncbi:elongation factor EF-1 alpha subunit [Phyllosticta capitalensis]|uniref:elongation factor EF-1 alpha subunit n=1 Tax=Phyllosticta capitalensis TaxID=121624 RepID=UPI0031316CC2